MALRDDTLYVGGNFSVAGGLAGTEMIAAWSIPDQSWRAMGTGVTGGELESIVPRDDTVYVAGRFTSASGVASTTNLAAWSVRDDTWHAIYSGASLNSGAKSLALVGDDSLYVGGTFTNAGTGGLALLNLRSGAWSSAGATGMTGGIYDLALRGGSLYAVNANTPPTPRRQQPEAH